MAELTSASPLHATPCPDPSDSCLGALGKAAVLMKFLSDLPASYRLVQVGGN